MATRRMFSLEVVDTDLFLDLPLTSQALYFHLGMRADDDGFISSPKRIIRLLGCGEDDLNILITRGYVIPFESGVVVIRHWLMQNKVQPSRKNATQYQEVLGKLAVNNDVYDVPGNCRHNADETTTTARQDVDKTLEQVRLGKGRLGKVKKEEPAASSVSKHEIPKPSPLKVESEEVEAYFTTPKVNKAFNEFLKARKDLKVKNTDRAVKLLVDKLNPFPPEAQYEAITESIMNGWKGVFPKNGGKSGKGIEQNPFVDFIEDEDSPAFTQLFNQEDYTIE